MPLLEIPLTLMLKHLPDLETAEPETKIFRVYTNQWVNGDLKDLAVACGIKKVLTFHIARHTFATTVTLNNGVPIESLSSMMGHKNIATTQHYAKLLDKKLEVDMAKLSSLLPFSVQSPAGSVG